MANNNEYVVRNGKLVKRSEIEEKKIKPSSVVNLKKSLDNSSTDITGAPESEAVDKNSLSTEVLNQIISDSIKVTDSQTTEEDDSPSLAQIALKDIKSKSLYEMREDKLKLTETKLQKELDLYQDMLKTDSSDEVLSKQLDSINQLSEKLEQQSKQLSTTRNHSISRRDRIINQEKIKNLQSEVYQSNQNYVLRNGQLVKKENDEGTLKAVSDMSRHKAIEQREKAKERFSSAMEDLNYVETSKGSGLNAVDRHDVISDKVYGAFREKTGISQDGLGAQIRSQFWGDKDGLIGRIRAKKAAKEAGMDWSEKNVRQQFLHKARGSQRSEIITRRVKQVQQAASKSAKKGASKALSASFKAIGTILKTVITFLTTNPIGWIIDIILIILILLLSTNTGGSVQPVSKPDEMTIERVAWINRLNEQSKEFYEYYHTQISSDKLATAIYVFRHDEAYRKVVQSYMSKYEVKKYSSYDTMYSTDGGNEDVSYETQLKRRQEFDDMSDRQVQYQIDKLYLEEVYKEAVNEYIEDLDTFALRQLFLDKVEYIYTYMTREWSEWNSDEYDDLIIDQTYDFGSRSDEDDVPEDEIDDIVEDYLKTIEDERYEQLIEEHNEVDETFDYAYTTINVSIPIKYQYDKTEYESADYNYCYRKYSGIYRSSYSSTNPSAYTLEDAIDDCMEDETMPVDYEVGVSMVYKKTYRIRNWKYRDITSQGWITSPNGANVERDPYRDTLQDNSGANGYETFSWAKYDNNQAFLTDLNIITRAASNETVKRPENEHWDGVETRYWHLEEICSPNGEKIDSLSEYSENDVIKKTLRMWKLRPYKEVYDDLIENYNPIVENEYASDEHNHFFVYKEDEKFGEIEIEIDKEQIYKEYYYAYYHPEDPKYVCDNMFNDIHIKNLQDAFEFYLEVFKSVINLADLQLLGGGFLPLDQVIAFWNEILKLDADLGGLLYGDDYNCTQFVSYFIYQEYGILGIGGNGMDKAAALIAAHPDQFELSDLPKSKSVASVDFGDGIGHTIWIDEVDYENGKIVISEGNRSGEHTAADGNSYYYGSSTETAGINYQAVYNLDEWNAKYGNSITYAIPKN